MTGVKIAKPLEIENTFLVY